jgi:hypothetical protein
LFIAKSRTILRVFRKKYGFSVTFISVFKVSDCKEYSELSNNNLAADVDISGYTISNQYTCPSDGYVALSAYGQVNDFIRAVVYGANGSYYFNITAYKQIAGNHGMNAVFVKKGMKVYVQSYSGSVSASFLGLT